MDVTFADVPNWSLRHTGRSWECLPVPAVVQCSRTADGRSELFSSGSALSVTIEQTRLAVLALQPTTDNRQVLVTTDLFGRDSLGKDGLIQLEHREVFGQPADLF